MKKGDRYEVSFTVSSLKKSADSTGKETEVPSENYVEIGIYKDRKSLTTLNRYKLKTGETKMTMAVDYKPYKVMVDPRMLLIDRKLDDNEMKLDNKDDNKEKVVGK